MTKLAIVGFGKWGAQLFESLQTPEGQARFSTIVSRSPERFAANEKTRGLKVYTRLDQALTDDSIDGIVLATPHSQHAAEVVQCAAARKHVFVEKPFALTKESCEQALSAVSKAGTVVAVGHNRRFLPALTRMKAMLTAGQLGELMHIETTYTGNAATEYTAAHWRVAPGESPAGGLAGSGIHMIDAIICLGGPIAEVFATAARRSPQAAIDDTTAVLFKLASGASASLTNIVATARTYGIRLFGSAGAVELRGHDQLIVTDLSGKTQVEDFKPINTARFELVAFADAIEGRAPYPIPPADILNSVATFEATCRSVERGEKIRV